MVKMTDLNRLQNNETWNHISTKYLLWLMSGAQMTAGCPEFICHPQKPLSLHNMMLFVALLPLNCRWLLKYFVPIKLVGLCSWLPHRNTQRKRERERGREGGSTKIAGSRRGQARKKKKSSSNVTSSSEDSEGGLEEVLSFFFFIYHSTHHLIAFFLLVLFSLCVVFSAAFFFCCSFYVC